MAFLILAPSALAGTGVVRVDQLGYAAGGAKRAYLMSSAPDSGATYEVRRADGSVLFQGTVGAPIGKWTARFPDVYALDFDAVQDPGVYSIQVAGQVAAASPGFTIGAANAVFGGSLANALTFYRTERDGPDFIPGPLRTAPGHLNDRRGRTYRPPRTNADGSFAGDLTPLGGAIDASGGWWDAGDYLKFVQTTSYAVDLMLVGVRDFPGQMGAAAGATNFTAEAKFGLSWLLRMWDDRTRTLYFQVGIGSGNNTTLGDHDLWRLPQADDSYGGGDPLDRYIRHRPVFRAGPPGSRVSPNLAGRDAAAFALCFQVFRRSSPALASRCLRAGEHIFDLADAHPRRLVTTVPYGFYPETEWRDDLELGATELANALASGPPPRGLPHRSANYYLGQASVWARRYMAQGDADSDPLNLYDVSGLADYELFRALSRPGTPGGLAVIRTGLVRDLGRQLAEAEIQARSDAFGYGVAWDGSDTASYGAGLSVLAAEYAALTGSSRYRALSTRWLDNILGANGWGESLIIGDGSQFPRCPQHQVANLAGSLSGRGAVLAGAVVEGPSASASSGAVGGMRPCPGTGPDPFAPFNGPGVFRDDVQSYSTVEPAIDLTASSPLAFAWQIRTAGP